ncbi:MAG TPA: efflux RND transporter periplasmic adaptor subunit [Burkholderiales bacterium]|nr:efflux RND transporter periplasmic adaptor subunit [Burkholderiales bacterium]
MTTQEPEYKSELTDAQLAAAHFRENPRPRRRGFGLRWILVVVILAVVAGAFAVGMYPRIEAKASLKKETQELAIQSVAVIKAKNASPAQELVLPGNMQAFSYTPIYARTSGYLKRWYADIGKRVKAGELLAEIDTPEIDDQLAQARADTATAEANYKFAESTSKRWEALLKTDSVSRQEADEKRSDLAAKKAVYDAARYNVNRLEKLQSFKKLYAPFDGIITARNTDIGTLIDAGSGPTKELYRLAATKRMRVFVNVPQSFSRDVTEGMEADLTLGEYPDRKFKGTVARSTQAIDASSRTLLVEIDVDNPDGALLPGSYVVVHLKTQAARPALVLPVNTLLFRPEGVMVAVLQGDKAILTPIKIGRDYGNAVEVLSGITASDTIIVNPSDSLASGATVRVVQEAAKPEAAKADAGAAPKPEAGKPEAPKAPATQPAAPEKKG